MFDPVLFRDEIRARNAVAARLRRTENDKLTRVSFQTDTGRYYGPIENVIFRADHVIFTDYETPSSLATGGTFVMLPAETIKSGRAYKL